MTDYEALRDQRMAELDAETRQIYEVTGSSFGIPRLGVKQFRELFATMVGRGSGVDSTTGIMSELASVSTRHGSVPVKVYRPEGVTQPLGAFVHTHAGGWIAGEGFQTWDADNAEFCRAWGCVVVHPDFDLPPERKFPVPVEQCFDVTRWAATDADRLGIDPSRIAVGGGCTGANLAAVVALMARDAGLPLAAQYLWAPQMDCRTDYRSHAEFGVGYGLSHEDDAYVIDQYLKSAEDRWDWRASPVLVESVLGVAPAIFAVGEYEILRDASRLYASRLRDSGVPTYYFEGKAQGHGHTYWRNMQTGTFTKAALESQRQVNTVMQQLIGPSDQSTPATEVSSVDAAG